MARVTPAGVQHRDRDAAVYQWGRNDRGKLPMPRRFQRFRSKPASRWLRIARTKTVSMSAINRYSAT